jgi:hypothetical protein
MTKKAEFNAEEWSRLLEGPALAGLIVIAAERGGSIRESLSMAKAYNEARAAGGDDELLTEILNSRPEINPREYGDPAQLHDRGLQRLRETMTLLNEKATPEEAADYRRFVLDVARHAAEAHKEGGFLGIGGERVSEAEQKALDDVAAALGDAGGTG